MAALRFTVQYGADFYGSPGYSHDGWTGETPEEAALLSLTKAGMNYDEAFDVVATAKIDVEGLNQRGESDD